MKKILSVLAMISVAACGSYSNKNEVSNSGSGAQDANSLGMKVPAGQHYQLNLIGVPKGKSADMTGNSGHRIFLPLYGTSKILLSPGEFAVLDANGTDGSASFQLPAPDADGDGITSYSVFARPLGKPGGSLKMTTCATDPLTGEEICSLETMVSTRAKGKSSFTNVSKELLSISADIDGDGIIDRVSLFDDRLEDYLWSADNNGLRLLQLRFIEVPTKL